MPSPHTSEADLHQKIIDLAPWHHNVEINPAISTGKPFTKAGDLLPAENQGVGLIQPRNKFLTLSKALYPNGMEGKRFLDCACNAGAYCFYARELGAEFSFGFDIRQHWIDQAHFIQQHRTCAPTDNIEFRVMDLLELGAEKLQPFDFTYFSGIFYHLPDPMHGLKLAADLTQDILLLNTAGMTESQEPLGMTMIKEGTKPLMSGAYQLAWFPNSPQMLVEILAWLGFVEFKLTRNNINAHNRRRMEIIAAREKGRLALVKGETLKPSIFCSET